MYREGLGVPKDNKKALIWFLEAAKDKNVAEQFMLGSYYRIGLGTPQDNIKAYAWFGIAAAGGLPSAQIFRDQIESELSTGDLEEAHKLARELWAKYGNRDDVNE